MAGDLNEDGHPDFAAAAGLVYVGLGTGTGGFQAVREVAADQAESIAVADINQDRHLDLVTTSGAGTVSVLLGSGDGNFGTPQVFVFAAGSGAQPSGVVGRFNSDHAPDVAVADDANDAVSVRLNAADWVASPTLTISDARIIEGNSGSVNAVFVVTLSAASASEVRVQYATENGWSATAGTDYTATSGTLTFAPGVTSKTIAVPVFGDILYELDEQFTIKLMEPVHVLLADHLAVGTIVNDDPAPVIAISDVTVTEGNSGSVNAVFTVTLSAPSAYFVRVFYATADGSATAGSDYVATSGRLGFAPGQTSATITVSVLGDRLGEPIEIFFVNLSNPDWPATIADGQGVGTIVDDEPRVSISDVAKYEGKRGKKTLFTFTVTLSAAYDQPVTVSFRTVDGTATTGAGDYLAKTGTLTFNRGETTKTITIEVIGDRTRETDEVFYVDLFGLSSNALFTKTRGRGTLLGDD